VCCVLCSWSSVAIFPISSKLSCADASLGMRRSSRVRVQKSRCRAVFSAFLACMCSRIACSGAFPGCPGVRFRGVSGYVPGAPGVLPGVPKRAE
jgi:hypothetical protein